MITASKKKSPNLSGKDIEVVKEILSLAGIVSEIECLARK